jgi:hypothetical protein
MSFADLNPAQEQIVRNLVKLHREGYDGEFSFHETFADHGFYFDGEMKIVAEESVVRALAERRLIAVRWPAAGEAVCMLEQAAYAAVRSDFGGSRRRRFLDAVYDLTDGNPLHGTVFSHVLKQAKLSEAEGHGIYLELAQSGLISGSSGGAEGPNVYLTSAGVQAVQSQHTPKPPSAVPSVFHIDNLNVTGHGAAVAVGVNNTATVNAAPSDLLLQIQHLRAQVDTAADQHEAIREVLQDLTDIVQAGQTQSPRWSEGLTQLAELGKPYAELVKTLLSFGTALG